MVSKGVFDLLVQMRAYIHLVCFADFRFSNSCYIDLRMVNAELLNLYYASG